MTDMTFNLSLSPLELGVLLALLRLGAAQYQGEFDESTTAWVSDALDEFPRVAFDGLADKIGALEP